ncbi:MAG: serine/threonine-protein kinase [Cyanobacteria bacterium J06621_8]
MTALLNNRYRIIKTLGRGGFGETYLTEDTHMPSRRKCVLKQLKPMVKQPKTPLWIKERFQREAAILEELGNDSNQIPKLYAYFSEGDKFYLVQEWIEGLTLGQYWSQEGNLHRDEVRKILGQLLPVLDYVHSRRIIHRDIKPDNIILRGEDKLPFLIDFGAVKEAIATEVNVSSDSIYSASIGTPGYMSSEQAAGRPIYSSDLYGLGLTAIFLLTGKSPHELDTDPRNGEIIWREHAFNLDPELASVLDRAIRFHPRDRFASAAEMLRALQQNLVATGHNPTGVTLNVAPQNNSPNNSLNEDYRTNQRQNLYEPHPRKRRSWLTTAALLLLVTVGVAAGTFAAGFTLISRMLRSPEAPEVAQPIPRQPEIFIPESKSNETKTEEQLPSVKGNEALIKLWQKIAQEAKLAQEEAETELESSEESKPPKTIAKVDVEPESEISIPILSTGASESQLVSTLGQPNSERIGRRPNSKELVYYNVAPDQVNLLRYQSDDTGKIRQADVYLNQSVSLGAMQETLSQMLGQEAPADIKDKLRLVYNRQTNLRSFKIGNLAVIVKRDPKDRVHISVSERDF